MGILIEPVGEVTFKWGGTSSILISGPVNTGYYEPLPLPSTVYGFLKYAFSIKGLKEKEPRFSGPAFYSDFGDMELMCVHVYPRGLACNFGESKLCYLQLQESAYKYHIGIALDRQRKAAKEDYIYTTKMLSYSKISRLIYASVKGEVKEPKVTGVYLEADAEDSALLDGFVGPFGGESRMAKVVKIEPSLKKVHKKVLASPAMIDSGNFESVEWNGKKVDIKTLDSILEEPKGLKVIFRLLSLGFNVDRRLPMQLSVMPSLIVEDATTDRVGRYTETGWGSVIEI